MTMKVNTRTRLFFAVSLNLVLVRCLTSELCLCFPGYSVIMMQPGGVHCCKGSVHNCKGSVDNGKGSIHNRKVSIHNRKVSVHNCKGSENGAVSLGQFAVQEHNKKENTLLEFVRVLTAKEQVVAGKLYHLTLEVIDAGKNKIYEAKVWVKPWRNFKQLQEFKPAPDVQSFSPLDLGAKHGNS